MNKPEGSVVASPAALEVVSGCETSVTYHDPAAYKPESAVLATEVVNQNSNNNGISSDSVGELKRERGRRRKCRAGKYPLPGDGTNVPMLAMPPPPRPPPPSGTKHVATATYPSLVSAVSGQSGVGFMPHIITVGANEDVWAKLISFALINTEAVCVLSATGTISNATLQHGLSSAVVTYMGTFEILSLSGSFLLSESGGHCSRTGGLSVTLSGRDGRNLGGVVAGPLHAHSPVQVIVGTFMVKDQQQVPRQGCNEYDSAIPRLNSSVGGSPTTRPTLTESSGGPLSMSNHNAGGCNYPQPAKRSKRPVKVGK